MISLATRLASLIGIEKPSPMLPLVLPDDSDAIAELTPTILPCESNSAPPELPGLIAASVCIASIYDSAPTFPVVTGLLRAETIPLVTVLANPNGDPIATTGSPMLNLDESPKALEDFPVES
jgi:hypothetical protein